MATIVNAGDIALGQLTSRTTTGFSNKQVRLTGDNSVFKVDKNGNLNTQSILLTAKKYFVTGTVVFTTVPQVTLTGTGDTRTLTHANFGANSSVNVTASVVDLADNTTYEETITITKIVDGADSVVARLTRDSIALAADTDGNVNDYTLATTTFSIYVGTVDDSANWSITVTKSVGVSLTETGSKTVAITNLTTEMGTVTFTASKIGYPTLTSIFTITKARSGSAGTATSAAYVTITGDQVFKFLSGSTVPTPTSVTLIATLYGGLSNYSWEYYNPTTGWTSLNINTQTATIQHNNAIWGTATTLRIRCVSGNYNDELTLIKLYDGIPAVVYDIVTSSPLITKQAADIISDGVHSSITIQGKKYSGATTESFGWITVTANGNTETTTAVNSSSGSSYTLTIPDNAAKSEYVIKLYDQSTIAGATLLATKSLPVAPVEGDSYDVEIESTNGSIFRVGQSVSTNLIAHVFKNGVEITSILPTSYFKWRRVSAIPKPAPNDDATWNSTYQAGYKQITVSVDDVNARATFFCDIVQ
jgi:hypothetical protein